MLFRDFLQIPNTGQEIILTCQWEKNKHLCHKMKRLDRPILPLAKFSVCGVSAYINVTVMSWLCIHLDPDISKSHGCSSAWSTEPGRWAQRSQRAASTAEHCDQQITHLMHRNTPRHFHVLFPVHLCCCYKLPLWTSNGQQYFLLDCLNQLRQFVCMLSFKCLESTKLRNLFTYRIDTIHISATRSWGMMSAW